LIGGGRHLATLTGQGEGFKAGWTVASIGVVIAFAINATSRLLRMLARESLGGGASYHAALVFLRSVVLTTESATEELGGLTFLPNVSPLKTARALTVRAVVVEELDAVTRGS
jgi:hypothetical protein